MNNFHLIKEHFCQLHCAYCDTPFAPEGVELLREEDDYWVVKVCCCECQQQAGVAIVGIEYEETQEPCFAPVQKEPASAVLSSKCSDLNSSDRQRFTGQTVISTDEVLDAHNFFQNLGSDWMKFIPSHMKD